MMQFHQVKIAQYEVSIMLPSEYDEDKPYYVIDMQDGGDIVY
ncbi:MULTISPECIES: hypothetical protein [Lysinibacillus]|nr:MULTISPECIES: hypothetical protein [Lysinibacillus]